MRDLVPASLHLFERSRRLGLVASVDISDIPTVELLVRGRRGGTSMGRFLLSGTELREALARFPKAKRRSLTLQVCPDLLLEREVVLPLAAAQDLKRVMAYEMDRLTPFRAEEVFWTCRAGQRDTVRNQLHVRITIIPRLPLQPVLAALQQAGFDPVQIEAGGMTKRCQPIFLEEGRPDRTWLRSRYGAVSLAGCGILSAAAVALPFILQSVAGAGIDGRIDEIKPQAIEAERLRNKIASGAMTVDAIATARGAVSTPLQAIALLTDALPDDTFLTTLSTLRSKLTISGRSASAARLIGAMTAVPQIHNAAFTAPVIRDEINGGEMFSISAELGR